VPQDYNASSAVPCLFIHSIYVIPCLYIRSLSVMLSRTSFHVLYDRLKKDQEKDKIRSKQDKNGKRGEAGKCQKQLQ
nr:hypothetical protein [Tanacetum cinerariifolium]